MDVSVSKEGLDPEWDRFLETLPGGCYHQSSLWAKVEALKRWKHVRLVVREHGSIVGGVQALLRSVPLFGAVGFVSRGPAIASEDPAIQEFVLDQLDRVARAEHILFLKIQPACNREDLAQRLLERSALPSELNVAPLATSCVDLRQEPDAILALMHHKTRYNIRRAERKGLTVRQGTEADIPILLRLARIHAEHHRYSIPRDEYYYAKWSILSPPGYFSFFIVEYEGEALTAGTYMLFGDVVVNKLLVDSGRRRDLNPQSLLHWKVMLWARDRGAVWYDFGGIKKHIARAIVNGEPIPDTRMGRLAKFKTSFGGQVIFRPDACDISFVWPRRLTVRMVPLVTRIRPLLDFLIGGWVAGYVWRQSRAAKQAVAEHGSDN